MGKIIFLFAFALIVLQACSGASVKSPRNEMDDLMNKFLGAINEANRLRFFADDELSTIVSDYNSDSNRVLREKSGYPILENLRVSISKTESVISDNSKNCIDSAWRLTMIATEELKRGTDNCQSEAHQISSETKTDVSNAGTKATDLRVRLVTGMHQCMLIGEDIDEANVKCLEDLIEVLNQELADLVKEFDDVHENIIKQTKNGLKKLNICLDQVKEDITLKSETILGNLNQCTQKLTSSKFAPRSILDIIKDLKAKIEKIVEIISLLPTSIDQIPEKLQEIISHLNIIAISKQLESEIDELINDGGRDAEKCRPAADQKLKELVESSEKAAKLCIDSADGEIQAIKAQIAVLVDEAKTVLKDFNKQLSDCTWENVLNPIGFAKCLQLHYDEYKQRVVDLQKKVTDAIESVTNTSDGVLKDVAECVNKVQVVTVEEGQNLIKSVEKCVITIQ